MRIQALRKGVGCLLSCAVLSGCAREAPPVSAESVCASSSVSVSSASTGQTVSSAPSTVPDTSGPAGRSTVTRAAVTTAGSGGKSTAGSTTAPSSSKTAPAPAQSQNTVELIGRFYEKGAGVYQFEWSGSTISAGFIGTGIAIKLRITLPSPDIHGGLDYLNVSIDGGAPTVLKVNENTVRYPLASGLPDGYHTVRVTKRTEAQFGSQLQFEGFDYGGGKPAPAPARKTRRIEVYGDSISAGYGNEGTAPGFRLEEENASLTYGMLAADALNAECTVIALSGHGCFVSLSGSKTEVVPKYFNQILYKNRRTYAFPSPDPDAVIVHLGTNDYAMNVLDADFYTAYQAFVRRIRREYPKAYIVLAAGGGTTRHLDLLQRVADVCRERDKDTRVGCFVGVYTDADVAEGADGHPSSAGHRQLAEQLTAYLKETLNW